MAKIGIFDSGVGGLSVLKEIRRALPSDDCVYFADNANCPYGEKSQEFIIARSRAITDFLLKEGCSIIVIACNTATAAAIATLRKEYNIKFIGMEPAVKYAVEHTSTGTVGVLATAGTLAADKYKGTRDKYEGSTTVIEHTGSGFVELVEQDRSDGAEALETVGKSLMPLLEAGADRIVLGCTHYPFLAGTMTRIIDDFRKKNNIDYSIELIDPAPAVARRLVNVMKEEGIEKGGNGKTTLYASGDDEVLKRLFAGQYR